MSRRLFPFLPCLFLVGCAQGYPSFSGILPDVRVSGDERSYAERAEDCLKRRNCPPAPYSAIVG
ncbi:hypothetical protein AAIH24_33210, partial [Pseudomonas aeruginosa]|uniref:hypothetical protein n=1 Tax=Pseudomonas aeruginosa TaxID=287 RepID=UPI0031B6BC1A